MRRTPTLTLIAALALGGCSLHARLREPVDGDADSDADVDSDVDTDVDGDADLVVHEWGVFSGGDTHAGPGQWGGVMADKPILYFYPGAPMTVDVTVRFPGGSARETWPELALGETIAWSHVQVDPEPCAAPTPFPEWGEGQCEAPWTYFCEATELGSYTVPDAGCLTVGEVTSPLLFYAGRLGALPEPIGGSFCRDRTEPGPAPSPAVVTFQNRLDEPLGPTLFVYRNLEGECEPWGGCRIRSAVVGTTWATGLSPATTFEVAIDLVALTASEEEWTVQSPDWLLAEADSLAAVLTDAGLTDDEAEALLAGWRSTFFSLQPDDNVVSVAMGESLVAITLLPRSYFDDALPIEISPAPRELVRVGLGYGRLENGCAYPDDSSSEPPEGS